jgi:hypothetical protein
VPPDIDADLWPWSFDVSVFQSALPPHSIGQTPYGDNRN